MSIPCDAQSLVTMARGLDQIPAGEQIPVLISLFCQLANQASGGGGSGEKQFTSALFSLNVANVVMNTPHGLGGAPTELRAVLVCVAPDAGSGASIGDELDTYNFFDLNDICPFFAVKSNATNVTIFSAFNPVGSEAAVSLVGPLGPSTVDSFNNFRAKIYAAL